MTMEVPDAKECGRQDPQVNASQAQAQFETSMQRAELQGKFCGTLRRRAFLRARGLFERKVFLPGSLVKTRSSASWHDAES